MTMKGLFQRHTLRFRLLVAIGLILVICQAISVVWLWHESKEQILFLVDGALHNHNNQAHIEKEILEAVVSLVLPSLVMISLALLLCFQAVKWLTRPLLELQGHLDSRSATNLEPIGYISSVREIDAVILAINLLVSRLTATLERERLFTADVAHELRTPLAGLRLHLELIEKAHRVNVKPLIQRLDQMTQSVSQLLQLARVGQSFASGAYQQVPLIAGVIEPMQAEFTAMLQARNQTLTIDAPQEATVRGDATLLRAMLRNLVENAHRYGPEHSTIFIRVGTPPSPLFTVEDEGPGIDKNKSGELSKAFVRMDRRYGGIGLGLSIVTRIVQLHQAQFFLDNRSPGPGCRARVQFSG